MNYNYNYFFFFFFGKILGYVVIFAVCFNRKNKNKNEFGYSW